MWQEVRQKDKKQIQKDRTVGDTHGGGTQVWAAKLVVYPRKVLGFLFSVSFLNFYISPLLHSIYQVSINITRHNC